MASKSSSVDYSYLENAVSIDIFDPKKRLMNQFQCRIDSLERTFP